MRKNDTSYKSICKADLEEYQKLGHVLDVEAPSFVPYIRVDEIPEECGVQEKWVIALTRAHDDDLQDEENIQKADAMINKITAYIPLTNDELQFLDNALHQYVVS